MITLWETMYMNNFVKWRTIVALILMYVAIFMNWEWAWGVLFLYWVIPDLFSGVTYFVEPIYKKENPNLYWIIIFSWILMATLRLSISVAPKKSTAATKYI